MYVNAELWIALRLIVGFSIAGLLLALLALVKAADYWLQRFELTLQQRDSFDGAGYTAVNATLPALQLLILVALFGFLTPHAEQRRNARTPPCPLRRGSSRRSSPPASRAPPPVSVWSS